MHIPRRCSRFVGDGRKRPRRRILKRRDNGKRGEVRKKRKTGRTWPSLDILSIFRFPSRTGGKRVRQRARFERDGRGNAYFSSHPSIGVRGEISSIEKNVQRFSRNLRV